MQCLQNQFSAKQRQAIQLLARKDYENLTMDLIAAEVGVRKNSLYRWLSDPLFNQAVNRTALEVIKDLSPMALKATAELLASRDDRVKAKGLEMFLKLQDNEKSKEQLIEMLDYYQRKLLDCEDQLKELQKK